MIIFYLILALIVGKTIYSIIKAVRTKTYADLLSSLFMVPFLVFFVSAIMFGGDALFHDAAKNYSLYQQGHYYLVNHGNYTEVSYNVFLYMQIIEAIGLISILIGFILELAIRNKSNEGAIANSPAKNEGMIIKIPYTYYKRGLVFSIILLAAVLGIIILDILSLTEAIPINMIPSIPIATIHVLIITVFPLFMIPKIIRSYSLIKEKEADAVSTQGIVQDVKKAKDIGGVGGYTLNGKILRVQYIVIDNIKYYSLGGADGVKTGMSVEIKYLPTSKFILEIEKLNLIPA